MRKITLLLALAALALPSLALAAPHPDPSPAAVLAHCQRHLWKTIYTTERDYHMIGGVMVPYQTRRHAALRLYLCATARS